MGEGRREMNHKKHYHEHKATSLRLQRLEKANNFLSAVISEHSDFIDNHELAIEGCRKKIEELIHKVSGIENYLQREPVAEPILERGEQSHKRDGSGPLTCESCDKHHTIHCIRTSGWESGFSCHSSLRKSEPIQGVCRAVKKWEPPFCRDIQVQWDGNEVEEGKITQKNPPVAVHIASAKSFLSKVLITWTEPTPDGNYHAWTTLEHLSPLPETPEWKPGMWAYVGNFGICKIIDVEAFSIIIETLSGKTHAVRLHLLRPLTKADWIRKIGNSCFSAQKTESNMIRLSWGWTVDEPYAHQYYNIVTSEALCAELKILIKPANFKEDTQ
jgi:hypothetical protein